MHQIFTYAWYLNNGNKSVQFALQHTKTALQRQLQL